MRLYEKRRRRRKRQKRIILSVSAILVAGFAFLLGPRVKTQYGASGKPAELSKKLPVVKTEPDEQLKLFKIRQEDTFSNSENWSTDDSYLLAKIAMAEAEGECTKGKALVILVVLNRVWSDDFPNTIREVIYQDGQFTPVANGRFAAVEPNGDCWAAVESVKTMQHDYSKGALYFANCGTTNNWHSQNLDFLYQVGNHKFYK